MSKPVRQIKLIEKKLDAEKLGKLVRMLSTDADGEVVSAVAALRRLLEAAGLDLHDLADAAVAGLKPRAKRKSPQDIAPATARSQWKSPEPDLDSWESMARWLHRYRIQLNDDDRDYVFEVLEGITGFELGLPTT